MSRMRIAVAGTDDIIQPFLLEVLGDAATVIPPEAMTEPRLLDALLTSADAIVLMNGHPPDMADRDSRAALLAMRNGAKPILSAIERHGGLHAILVGSLRVHPQATPAEPYYGSNTRLAPRDVAAEGQLWVEERALEHATENAPVSILRTANVQGVAPGASEGHGMLHSFARECIFGWISVPGNGDEVKDFVHVSDVVQVILAVAEQPPPTRESLAIGRGAPVRMKEVAAAYAERAGCEPQYGQSDSNEIWGVTEAWQLEERLGFRPSTPLAEMIDEAFQTAGV